MSSPYPNEPHGRGTGSSVRAAIEIAPIARTVRAKVERELIALGAYGGTAEELSSRLRYPRVTVQPRVSELVAIGRVRNSGKRRRNPSSGKSAAVWVAVEVGADG